MAEKKKQPGPMVAKYIQKQQVLGRENLKVFYEACCSPEEQQQEVLRSILTMAQHHKNASPASTGTITSVKEFQEAFPLVTYQDIRHQMEAHYEHRVLETPGNKTLYSARSSRTAGAQKYIPVTEQFVVQYLKNHERFWQYNLLQDSGFMYGKIHNAVSPPKVDISPLGIDTGLLSGYMSARIAAGVPDFSLSIPKKVNAACVDTERDVLLMLHAVASGISAIVSVTTYPIFNMLKKIREDWDRISRLVQLSPIDLLNELYMAHRPHLITALKNFSLPPERKKIIGALSPSLSAPEFFSTLWPDLSHIFCWNHNSAGYYVRDIRELLPAVTMVSNNYIASEGVINVCMHNDFPPGAGPLCIDSLFFEFLENSSANTCHTLLAQELEIGKTYELVLTNWNHLYRYRLGDIIEVLDRYGNTPVVRFYDKTAKALTIFKDYMTHSHFKQALAGCMNCDPSQLSIKWLVVPEHHPKPHYVYYIEKTSSGAFSDRPETELDSLLQIENPAYARLRQTEKIGRARLQFLSNALFERFWRALNSKQQAAEQFKPRNIIDDPEDIALLNTVIQEHV